MKKSLLFILALLLTAAVVTATVLNSNKKTTKSTKSKCSAATECSAKKSHCPVSGVACY